MLLKPTRVVSVMGKMMQSSVRQGSTHVFHWNTWVLCYAILRSLFIFSITAGKGASSVLAPYPVGSNGVY